MNYEKRRGGGEAVLGLEGSVTFRFLRELEGLLTPFGRGLEFYGGGLGGAEEDAEGDFLFLEEGF
jgi:hypothetical protein